MKNTQIFLCALSVMFLALCFAGTSAACPLPYPDGNFSQISPASLFKPIPRTGNRKLLVILADFSDEPASTTQNQWNDFFFGANGFSTFFSTVSYSKLNYTGAVLNFVRLPNPKSYYSGGEAGRGVNFPQNIAGVFYDAVREIESDGVDLSPWADPETKKLQDVVLVFAGRSNVESGNQNDLQPTSFGLSPYLSGGYTTAAGYNFDNFTFCPELDGADLSSIGVCVHEHGHSLGMPDLNDLEYTKSGVGYYDTMGYGTYGADGGVTPFDFSAFSKSFFGWLTLDELGSSKTQISLPPIEQNASAIKLTSPRNSTEYFVLENRAMTGYNAGMPNRGLCGDLYIWHIDNALFEEKKELNLVNSPSFTGGPTYHTVQVVEKDGRGDLLKSPINYGECSDRFTVGDLWNDDSGARLFNGEASDLSVRVISKDDNGNLQLSINEHRPDVTPTPTPTAIPPSPTPLPTSTPIGGTFLKGPTVKAKSKEIKVKVPKFKAPKTSPKKKPQQPSYRFTIDCGDTVINKTAKTNSLTIKSNKKTKGKSCSFSYTVLLKKQVLGESSPITVEIPK